MRFSAKKGSALKIQVSLNPSIGPYAKFWLFRYDTGTPLALGDSGDHGQDDYQFNLNTANWPKVAILGLNVQPAFPTGITQATVEVEVFTLDPATGAATQCPNLDPPNTNDLFAVNASGVIASSPHFGIALV